MSQQKTKNQALLELYQKQQNPGAVMATPALQAPEPQIMGMPASALAQLVQQTSAPVKGFNEVPGRIATGYLQGQQNQGKLAFLQGVQQISQSNLHPDEKVNQLVGLMGQHGTDYGLGLQDIVKQYGDMSSRMPKPNTEWKPQTYEEAMQFEREKAGFKPPSQAMETTALYASRIKQANDVFGQIEKFTNNQNIGDMVQAGLPDWLNNAKSSEMQSYMQAKKNFLNAVLRRESGAVISEAEFKNGDRQYFPQYGDKPPVLAQKKANRDLVMKNFIKAAGNAYTPYQETDTGAGGGTGAAFYSPSTKKYYDAEGNEL